MRKAKLYQLLAVAGGLGAAVATTSAWAKPVDVVTPLNWTAGTATVDGDISDWGDLSGGNIMCTAGSIGVDGCEGNGKEHLSTVYLRYDCSSSTMYVLVLKEEGYDAQGERWVKVYDVQQSEYQSQVEDVVVNGESIGYETSFNMAPGTTYNSVEIHMNVSGNTSSTGKNGDSSSITVTECSEEPTLACNDLVGSNGVSMSVIATYKADGNGGYSKDSGTGNITIDADGNPSVDGGTVDIATFIEDGVQDSDGIVSGNIIQFCQVPVFDSEGAEVCLWTADKDAGGNYVNIEQVGCVDAEKGKFYAIEAAGEFSNALEAE